MHQKKPRLIQRTDRAWFSRLYNIRPGNGAGLFLEPRSPHGAIGLGSLSMGPMSRSTGKLQSDYRIGTAQPLSNVGLWVLPSVLLVCA